MSLLFQQLRSELLKPQHHYLVIIVLALMSLIYLFLQFSESWSDLSAKDSPVPVLSIDQSQAKVPPVINIQDFPPAFFGSYQPEPDVIKPTETPEIIPLSTAQLQLQAIYYSDQPALSAVTVSGGQGSGLYRESETLLSGIKILAIESDQVTLERNGQKEILMFTNDPRRLNPARLVAAPPATPGVQNHKAVKNSENTLEARLKKLRDRLQPEQGQG